MSESSSNPSKLVAAAEMPPIPDSSYEPQTSTSTLGDWGDQLPIGFLAEGVFRREIKFKPYTMAAERDLAKHRKGAVEKNPAKLTAVVIASMATEIGPYGDFQSLPFQQRLHVINQMYMGDVLYAYMLLRINALGDEVSFEVACPACEKTSRLQASLEDVDLVIPEDPYSIVRTHSLHSSIKSGKGTIKQLHLQPPRWATMTKMKVHGKVSMGSVKYELVSAAILGTDLEGVSFHKGMLDELTKRDFEYLVKTVDDNMPGPDLTLAWECPACGEEGQQSLRWDFDHFFGSSSL